MHFRTRLPSRKECAKKTISSDRPIAVFTDGLKAKAGNSWEVF